MLYGMLFRHPNRDTTARGRVTDETRMLRPYAGKTIGDIDIERRPIYDPGGNWLRRTANKTHVLTRERVVRRDLFFRPGDPLDTTRVDLRIRTRDSWTITADGALHSEGRTMFGLYDADILGTGNTLKIKTNFSRRDFSYGGNTVEYEIPNVLGTFFTAELAGGRDFYNSTLALNLHKEFLRPTDYEAGASYNKLKFKQYMIEEDSSRLIQAATFDLWACRRVTAMAVCLT